MGVPGWLAILLMVLQTRPTAAATAPTLKSHPLHPASRELTGTMLAQKCDGQLARPGELNNGPISKQALWAALENSRDEQLYVSRLSVVELGLVRDLRVRGDVVQVLMTTPGHGRPKLGFYSYGSGGNDAPIRDVLLRVPGVSKVVVDSMEEPAWNTNNLTEEGRRKLGLE